jgi:hypothetical protein
VSSDNPSANGLDIKSLAPPGANAFEGNICETSVNAPCGSVGPSLTASPNPIPISGNATAGVTTLSWNAPGAEVIEIRIGSPDGKLFSRMGYRGSIQTGPWVSDGMTFYLQDVTGDKPLTADYTLATVAVHLQRSSSAGLHFPARSGISALLLVVAMCLVRPRTILAASVLLAIHIPAVAQSSEQQISTTLDRMLAGHKSQRELAQYVFDTQGCKHCHTVGEGGKLGFTARGGNTAKGFEGCIAMLTAMNHIASAAPDRRTPQQNKKAARFTEFGCTFCHKMASDKIVITEIGAKLANLHLGCADIEKTLASKR